MSNGGSPTGSRHEHDSAASVPYHALRATEAPQMYFDGARRGGEDEVTSFLAQVQAEDRQRSEQAGRLLASRLGERRRRAW